MQVTKKITTQITYEKYNNSELSTCSKSVRKAVSQITSK